MQIPHPYFDRVNVQVGDVKKGNRVRRFRTMGCRTIPHSGQRWGADGFRSIFAGTVQVCVDARIATGEIVHIGASLIRANVAWESLVGQILALWRGLHPPPRRRDPGTS